MHYYNLKLLSPLFYRTRQDSGAAGANTTDPWVGDIAIAYAINSSLGLTRFAFDYLGNKPHYEELLSLPFLTSIASPVGDVKFTRVYDTATSFISQGYFNYPAFHKTENAPMRNWLKRQGLAPGNVFRFAVATRNGWVPPDTFTIRLGNMKEGVAYCSKADPPDADITVNLYTLKLLLSVRSPSTFRSLSELVMKLTPPEASNPPDLEYVMPQYILLRRVDGSRWLPLLEGYS